MAGCQKRLKILWSQRPWNRRGFKIIRNLAISVLLTAIAWSAAGFPLFFPTLEFRRWERESLLPPGEIVLSTAGFQNHRSFVGENNTSTRLTGNLIVSAVQDQVVVGNMDWKRFLVYPMGDGPVPIPLWGGELILSNGVRFNSPLLFLNMPREAVRAELELDVTYALESYHRTGWGGKLEDGMWLFGFNGPGDENYAYRWYEDGSCVLRAYDEDGILLGTWEETLPKPL